MKTCKFLVVISIVSVMLGVTLACSKSDEMEEIMINSEIKYDFNWDNIVSFKEESTTIKGNPFDTVYVKSIITYKESNTIVIESSNWDLLWDLRTYMNPSTSQEDKDSIKQRGYKYYKKDTVFMID